MVDVSFALAVHVSSMREPRARKRIAILPIAIEKTVPIIVVSVVLLLVSMECVRYRKLHPLVQGTAILAVHHRFLMRRRETPARLRPLAASAVVAHGHGMG